MRNPERKATIARQPIYTQTASGVMVQVGESIDVSKSASDSFLNVKERGRALLSLIADNGLHVNSECYLARLIRNAGELSDASLRRADKSFGIRDILDVMHANRIRNAVLSLDVSPRSRKLCDDGRRLFAVVTSRSLEGVVGKKLDSPYRAGRSKHRLKVRAPTARPQIR